jgi:spore cortex biosynthesis protein YabQ
MDNSIKVQGYIFLTSIYGGLIIGFVYDIYRVLRYFLKPKKIATFFEDLTFWIFASLIIFYILIKSNWGEIRGYIFIGFLVGTILYLKIGSKIVYPILLKIFKFISTLVYEFIKLILLPFRVVKKKLSPKTRKIKRLRKILPEVMEDIKDHWYIIRKKK